LRKHHQAGEAGYKSKKGSFHIHRLQVKGQK